MLNIVLGDIFEQFSLELAYIHTTFFSVCFIFFAFIILVENIIYYNIEGKVFFVAKAAKLWTQGSHIEFFLIFLFLFILSTISLFPVVLIILFSTLYISLFIFFGGAGGQSSEFTRFGFVGISLYGYVLEIIEKNIIINSKPYSFLIFETGLCISSLNILGIIPFSCSFTSQFLFPLCLSLSYFLFNNIVGICGYRFKLFNLFMPKGVPLFITPLLLLIEYISYFARIFSLSIRLCANMLSVHVLLKILVSFALILVMNTLWGQYLLGLLTCILLLDISTCFLQAYIFTFLSLIYLSNIIVLH